MGDISVMDQFWLSLIGQAPAAAAILIVVIKMLAFLKDERSERAKELDERHAQYFKQIDGWLKDHRQLAEKVTEVVDANTAQSARMELLLEQHQRVLERAGESLRDGD